MTTRHAFTLIELLLVIVIAIVFMTVSTSSFLSLRRNAEVRGAVDRYIAKHALARATAVRMGRTAELRADTVGRRLWVEVQRTSTARDTVGGITYFEDGLRFRTDRTVLCFDARGLARAGGACEAPAATVVFSHSGRADTVRTTALGRVLR